MRKTRPNGSSSGLNQTSAILSPLYFRTAHCLEGGCSAKFTPHLHPAEPRKRISQDSCTCPKLLRILARSTETRKFRGCEWLTSALAKWSPRPPAVREELQTSQVPVTTVTAHKQTYAVSVPVTHTELQSYQVPVRELQPKTESTPSKFVRSALKLASGSSGDLCREGERIVNGGIPCTIAVRVPYQVRVYVPVFGRPY